MKYLKPNDQRAKYAVILIWVVMTIDIISMISGYFQLQLLQSVEDGIPVSSDTADANDFREQIIGIANLTIFIVSAITFIMWFRRAYYNLNVKVHHLRFSDDWAAGCWFVPIISLYRPFQMMKELFQETKKYLSINKLEATLSINIVVWWWTLWLVSNFVGQFVTRYSLRADTIDELLFSAKASIVNDFIGIPLAIIAVKLIREYAKVEPLLFVKKIEEAEITLN